MNPNPYGETTMNRILPLLCIACMLLAGCSTPRDGAASNATTTPTQGAQTIGGSQEQANAAETGSASASANPVIINAFAAKTVKVNVKDNETAVEIEGNDEAAVEIGKAAFGNQTFGNENTQSSSVSSGSETGNK